VALIEAYGILNVKQSNSHNKFEQNLYKVSGLHLPVNLLKAIFRFIIPIVFMQIRVGGSVKTQLSYDCDLLV